MTKWFQVLMTVVCLGGCSNVTAEDEKTHTTRIEKLPDGKVATILDRPGEDEDYAVITDAKYPDVIEAGQWKNGKRNGQWAMQITDKNGKPTLFQLGKIEDNQFIGIWAQLNPGGYGTTSAYTNGKVQGEVYTETIAGSGSVAVKDGGEIISTRSYEVKIQGNSDGSLAYSKSGLPAPKNGLRFYTTRPLALLQFNDHEDFEETAMTTYPLKEDGFWLWKREKTQYNDSGRVFYFNCLK